MGYLFSKLSQEEVVPYECAVCFTKNQKKLISPSCCQYKQVYCIDCLQTYCSGNNINSPKYNGYGILYGNCMTCNTQNIFINKRHPSYEYYVKLSLYSILFGLCTVNLAVLLYCFVYYVTIFNSYVDIIYYTFNTLVLFGFLAHLYLVAEAFMKYNSNNTQYHMYITELKYFAIYIGLAVSTSFSIHNSDQFIIAPYCSNCLNYLKCLNSRNETHFSEICYNASYPPMDNVSLTESYVNPNTVYTNMLCYQIACMFSSILISTCRNLMVFSFIFLCMSSINNVFLNKPVRSLNPFVITFDGLHKMFDHYVTKKIINLQNNNIQSITIYPLNYKTVNKLPKQYKTTVQSSYPIDT